MTLLDPGSRSLYVDALRPPPGRVFDRGIATTYSLDLDTLLSLPLHLVLYAGESRMEELLHQGVALLDALRRTTRRLAVYCDRGRIGVPRSARVLFSLLEPVIHEVNLGEGTGRNGAFHPKVWLLRFAPAPDGSAADGRRGADGVVYRLLVLTRNLTSDVAWDVGLVLEGTPGDAPQSLNRPLLDFLRSLDGAASPDLLAEVARVHWDLPEGFSELRFHHLHPGAPPWRPPASDRLAVVSPFCGDAALMALLETTGTPEALVTRLETLAALRPDVRERFARQLCLHDAAETEDGEETQQPAAGRTATGLHAKLYLLEQGSEVRLVTGSANATEAVLHANQNVEFLVELVGRRTKRLGIDAFLSDEGFGAMLVDGSPLVEDYEPTEDLALDRLLEGARRALRDAALRLEFAQQDELWAASLIPGGPVAWDLALDVRAWLVTVPDDYARDAGALGRGQPVELGAYAPQSVTSLLALEVAKRGGAERERIRFVLNVPVRGLPAEVRDAALTRQIVSNEEGFLRYLLLLLGDLDVESGHSDLLAGMGLDGKSAEFAAFDELPILEEMARSYARSPERLDAVEELMQRLRTHAAGADDVVPEDFHRLWDTFQTAMERRT